jgi:transcriptional regulator with XRE-family HTH domain
MRNQIERQLGLFDCTFPILSIPCDSAGTMEKKIVLEEVRGLVAEFTRKRGAQTKLAEISGVGQSDISNFVNNKSNMGAENICRILDAMGFSVTKKGEGSQFVDEQLVRAKVAQEVALAMLELGIEDEKRHAVTDVVNRIRSVGQKHRAAGNQ